MAITALQLITNSMRLLGAVASGELPSTEEQTDALSVLNDLLDSCNNKGLVVFANSNSTFNLVGGQQTYTIGPSAADFTANRPVGIEYAFVNYNSLDFPIRLLNQQQWNAITLKNFQAPIPNSLYYVGEYPLGVINIWPIPSAAMVITLSVNMQFSPLASLAASIAYPPGYAKWLRYQLACELAPEFKLSVPSDVKEIARDELGDIQAANRQQPVSNFDTALTGGQSIGIAGFLGGY